MEEGAMSTEVWATISAVIVILVAIATSHRALRQEMHTSIADLRREMNERFGKVDERIDGLRAEMNERFGKADERIAALRAEMIERFGTVDERITALRAEMIERFGKVDERIAALRGELIERLSHVEGLLGGIGHVLRKRAGKEHRDSEHGSVPQE